MMIKHEEMDMEQRDHMVCFYQSKMSREVIDRV
jgi:hypothetical protein